MYIHSCSHRYIYTDPKVNFMVSMIPLSIYRIIIYQNKIHNGNIIAKVINIILPKTEVPEKGQCISTPYKALNKYKP